MNVLRTARLVLEPLTVAHAPAMFEVLRDAELYRSLDYGPPPDLAHVERVYAELERRTSPDGAQQWLNWIVIRERPIGVVQATIENGSAEIAYVFARDAWGHGYAEEAVKAMIEELRETYGVTALTANVDEKNERSIRLLQKIKGGPESPPLTLKTND